jgi:hypothetical protein
MRDKDIKNAKISHTQGHRVPKWAEGMTASELHTQHPEAGQRYDDLQMKLIKYNSEELFLTILPFSLQQHYISSLSRLGEQLSLQSHI